MATPNINQVLRKDPRHTSRGAPLGDTNFHLATSPLYLQRVRFVDGDYAPDGTYWGNNGTPLWCAFNGDDGEDAAGHGSRIYVRAETRDEAKTSILADYPNVRFFR